MLVLSRKVGEQVMLGDRIVVTVLKSRDGKSVSALKPRPMCKSGVASLPSRIPLGPPTMKNN